jgi:hypothetical protein
MHTCYTNGHIRLLHCGRPIVVMGAISSEQVGVMNEHACQNTLDYMLNVHIFSPLYVAPAVSDYRIRHSRISLAPTSLVNKHARDLLMACTCI